MFRTNACNIFFDSPQRSLVLQSVHAIVEDNKNNVEYSLQFFMLKL